MSRLISKVGQAVGRACWRSGVTWPLVVATDKPWEEYLRGLSESGRRYYRKARKLNADRLFEPVPFEPAVVRAFMDVWSRRFSFPNDYFARLERLSRAGRLACFAAKTQEQTVALQLVEKYGRYGRCHAPWFDKDALEESSVATYMWFSLIEHAARTGEFERLDLGGGPLSRLAPDHYKRRYGPESAASFLRRCPECEFMFVLPLSRLRGASCPSCGRWGSVGWAGLAALALSRLPKPRFGRQSAKTTRFA